MSPHGVFNKKFQDSNPLFPNYHTIKKKKNQIIRTTYQYYTIVKDKLCQPYVRRRCNTPGVWNTFSEKRLFVWRD